MSLFTASENLPFGVGLALIVGVALIEGVGMLMAVSPSHVIDHWLPEFDGDGGLDRLLGWLHLGRVPALVVLLLFLSGYTVFGYAMQMVARGLFGGYLPAWFAGLAAVPAGLATVRGLGALIAHIIPRDETSAVSEQTLIGRSAVIVTGSARLGFAAQARVRDATGRAHYVMVEPDVEGVTLDEGAAVLIVRKVGAFYRGIEDPHVGLD